MTRGTAGGGWVACGATVGGRCTFLSLPCGGRSVRSESEKRVRNEIGSGCEKVRRKWRVKVRRKMEGKSEIQ